MTSNHTNNKIKTFSQYSWIEISAPYRAYMGTIVTALYLPTCTSSFVVQHSCQVSFKSMQQCRSSEDELQLVTFFKCPEPAAKFAQHVLSPNMHINTCGAAFMPGFTQIHGKM